MAILVVYLTYHLDVCMVASFSTAPKHYNKALVVCLFFTHFSPTEDFGLNYVQLLIIIFSRIDQFLSVALIC